jgi:hypothetical protein
MNPQASIDMRLFVRRVITVLLVGGSSFAVFAFLNQGMHLWFHNFSAGNLLRNTTTNGGDTGAHVWAPWYLKNTLLHHGEISGWSPDWFAGFPVLHFYFPFASLLIVALNAIHIPFIGWGIPYNVAFKLGTVAGVVSMPISAYVMGRCFNLKFPKPELIAVSILAFLFNTSFTIWGGNIASTLAGEFGFSISMSAALVFIGLYWQVLTKGRYRSLAAVFLAITILSHVLPTIFVFFVAGLMYIFHLDFSQSKYTARLITAQVILASIGLFLAAAHNHPSGIVVGLVMIAVGGALVYRDRVSRELLLADLFIAVSGLLVLIAGLRIGDISGILIIVLAIVMTIFHTQHVRLMWGVIVGAVGVCLASFWLVPFVVYLRLSNDMGWQKETTFVHDIFKGPMRFAVPLAILGFFFSFIRNNRLGILMGFSGIFALAVFILAPQHQLWNARALPFWYLTATILAAIGAGELLEIAAEVWEHHYSLIPAGTDLSWTSFVGAIVATLIVGGAISGSLGLWPRKYGLENLNAKHDDFITSWAKWNYSGYEDKGDAYVEYRSVINAMQSIGKQYGCGRAMWEYEGQEDRFGTPDALMLLPYWTKSCIGSMEGLYYESAATAPYHWINADELSEHPSNPQRDLPYAGHNVALGVLHLQAMGVRYYLAITPSSQEQADQNTNLQLLRTLPPHQINYDDGAHSRSWKIYLVKHAPLVEGLANQPAVATAHNHSRTDWLELAMHWYTNQTDGHNLTDPAGMKTVIYLTDGGPKAWQRTEISIDNAPDPPHKFYEATERQNDFGQDTSWDPLKQKALPQVKVTNVKQDDNDISFHVDKIGVPVLVKMSYFPNWKVSGAKGPYRSTPNFMIVVPTSHSVHLHYGRTIVNWFGIFLTLLGIAGAIVIWRLPEVEYPESETEFWRVSKNYRAAMSTDIGNASSLLRSLPEEKPQQAAPEDNDSE